MIVLTRRRVGETRQEAETLEFRTFKEAKQAAFGYEHARIRCDSCEMISINGMACHETGCPGARAEQAAENDDEGDRDE
jgi:hypothetical protein